MILKRKIVSARAPKPTREGACAPQIRVIRGFPNVLVSIRPASEAGFVVKRKSPEQWNAFFRKFVGHLGVCFAPYFAAGDI